MQTGLLPGFICLVLFLALDQKNLQLLFIILTRFSLSLADWALGAMTTF